MMCWFDSTVVSNFFPSTVDRSSVGKVGSGKTDVGVGKETNKNHGNDGQAPTQGAFESALNEVTQLISDEGTKSNISSAERTRQDFNLTMWFANSTIRTDEMRSFVVGSSRRLTAASS